MTDLNWREVAIFVPLILIVLWMGIYPASFTNITGPAIDQLVTNYQAAVGVTEPASIIGPAEAAPAEAAPVEAPAESTDPNAPVTAPAESQ